MNRGFYLFAKRILCLLWSYFIRPVGHSQSSKDSASRHINVRYFFLFLVSNPCSNRKCPARHTCENIYGIEGGSKCIPRKFY